MLNSCDTSGEETDPSKSPASTLWVSLAIPPGLESLALYSASL